jgi:hypothetical protein
VPRRVSAPTRVPTRASPHNQRTWTDAAEPAPPASPDPAAPEARPNPTAPADAHTQDTKITSGKPPLDRQPIGLYREHSASKRDHGPPGTRPRDHREGLCVSVVGTVPPPTTGHNLATPGLPSSALTTPLYPPLVGIFKDAEHTPVAGEGIAAGSDRGTHGLGCVGGHSAIAAIDRAPAKTAAAASTRMATSGCQRPHGFWGR